ncbi:hypothetical protein CYMTET_37989 [Cymbomonas tetramitiformis]|uniref:Mitochondrial carrier protein n=1 Tax=Cymbomonas tetramitiformis TaxID=36881 RepID=A0AAE0F645_9CHLO|nr:hypothetical protein CYMTET_37989 [Cymbomonas tetramitiformis]|eukprot:gene7762-9227_t
MKKRVSLNLTVTSAATLGIGIGAVGLSIQDRDLLRISSAFRCEFARLWDHKNWNAFCDACSGSFAEAMCVAALFPVDTIKVRKQAMAGAKVKSLLSLSAMKQLYAGVGAAVVGAALFGAAYMAIYEGTKRLVLPQTPTNLRPLTFTLATMLANIVPSLIEVPLDATKQRMQSGMFGRGGFWATFGRSYRRGGLPALYCGYLPFVLKTIPFEVVEFNMYEKLKDLGNGNPEENGAGKPPWQRMVCIGAISGTVAALVTMPIDCLKTYVNTRAPGSRPLGMLASGKRLFLERGIRGFFVGTVPRVCYHAPAGAIYFLAYEHCSHALLGKQAVADSNAPDE